MRGNNKLTGGTKPTSPAPVILGLVPRILFQQGTNLVNKLALLLNKYWLSVFCTFFKYPSPEAYASPSPSRGEGYRLLSSARNDVKRTNILSKGLDVVCQYAVLLERRVQRGTRARKALVVTRQANPLGRSMIEMLGVLAIIGVLSVGGIAGYSKAMEKWKQNKWIQQIEELIFNIKDTYKLEKQYGKHSEDILPALKEIGIVPQGLLDDDNRDLFGNRVSVTMKPYDIYTRLNLQFEILPNSMAEYNCRELFHLLPVYTDIIWTIVLCNGAGCGSSWRYRICGNARPADYAVDACVREDYNLTEVSEACKICKDDYCSVLILFDNNV